MTTEEKKEPENVAGKKKNRRSRAGVTQKRECFNAWLIQWKRENPPKVKHVELVATR